MPDRVRDPAARPLHTGEEKRVELDPAGLIGFRLARTRRTVYLTIEECFDRARKRQAVKDGAEKKGRKKR